MIYEKEIAFGLRNDLIEAIEKEKNKKVLDAYQKNLLVMIRGLVRV